MGHFHLQAIFNLEQEILRLQEKVDRYQAMLASALNSPETRSQARTELDLTVRRINAANEELARLISEL